jgi:hypothetical protein
MRFSKLISFLKTEISYPSLANKYQTTVKVGDSDQGILNCHAADSKPVKQEVNGTLILPPLVFSAVTNTTLNYQ